MTTPNKDAPSTCGSTKSSGAGRRNFLRASGLGALAFWANGVETWMSPAEARDRAVDFRILTRDEATTLEALGETLHPGAREAGIAHFVDQQLGLPVTEALLFAKHVVEPPYLGFYRNGLQALDGLSEAVYGSRFSALDETAAIDLVRSISDEPPAEWVGPPAPLFYLIVRGDAVDVVYADMDDYRRIGIPYMPHILPPRKW